MKNRYKKLLVLLLFFLTHAVLFAQPGVDDDAGTLEGAEPVPINDWLPLLFFIGLLLGFYCLHYRSKNTSRD